MKINVINCCQEPIKIRGNNSQDDLQGSILMVQCLSWLPHIFQPEKSTNSNLISWLTLNFQPHGSILMVQCPVVYFNRTRTPKAGRNSHFQHFLCKKAEKARNLGPRNMPQIFAKKHLF